MPRFKKNEISQGLLLPIQLSEQIIPGSFEHALQIIFSCDKIDTSRLTARYTNDHCGQRAYHPEILLKIILYGYYQGMKSSREMEIACRNNLTFRALAENHTPDHSTIAAFISGMGDDTTAIFTDVVVICHELGLIKGGVLAIDGCKMQSSAAKKWSGSIADLTKKRDKIRNKLNKLMEAHQKNDIEDGDELQNRIDKFKNSIEKLSSFLEMNEPRMGQRKREKKSNVTDNESALMKTSHGIIQGYNGVAVVDGEHQIIISAEAFGDGQEHGLLQGMVEKSETVLERLGGDIRLAKLLGDSGYFTEDNLKFLAEKMIDAYVPDQQARARDPDFRDRDRYRAEKKKKLRHKGPGEFLYDKLTDTISCPGGNALKRWGSSDIRGRSVRRYGSSATVCDFCRLRSECLRPGKRRREMHIYETHAVPEVVAMREKIDSDCGRKIYNNRFRIVEPVFGNIRYNKELNRFTLRGRDKVNVQWLLYCIVHNIEKIATTGRIELLSGAA